MPASLRAAIAAGFLLLSVFVDASGFDDGKAAFGRQDWSAASAALAKFLAANPESPDAPAAAFLRGVALYQLGDYRASLDAFQKLERTWPQSTFTPRLPYWKGTAALGAGQNALAERELSAQARFADQEPFTTRALLNLALARVALGNSDSAIEALTSFTKASTEAPLLAQAWAVWGDLDRGAGRLDAALTHYRASSQAHPGDAWDLWSRTQSVDLLAGASRWGEARTELEAAAAVYPAESARWDARRINVARGLGDAPGLLKALEAVWSREPDAKKKQDLASNRARAAEDAGKPEPAWWLKASQGPDAAVGAAAILRYASLLEAASRGADAAQALEAWTGPKTAPQWEDVRSRAALDRLLAGDPVKAALLWDRLLSDYPRSTRVPAWLLARGQARMGTGETKALADFTRLTKDFPQAPETLEARYQIGLIYLKRQEPSRAEAWFYGLVQDLKKGDLYLRALLARGIAFVNAGKADLARSSLQRLVRESPAGPWTGEAWSALGRNALQSGALEEAADAYAQAEAALTEPEAKAKALWSRAEALAGRPTTVEAASQAFELYAERYPTQPRVEEARYRQGAVFLPGKAWARALEVWTPLVAGLHGAIRAQTKEGLATVLLRLGRADEGWQAMEALEAETPSPEAWYRWGLAATSQGEGDWASRAFEYLLQHHPESSVAEAALPRAAGALLTGGKPDEALTRYADYFGKWGRQPSSAPVAKAAALGALPYPATLEALIKASRGWNLSAEVSTEFLLVWAQSRLDADPAAQEELKTLSQSAPWASQRSDALLILGKWHRDRGQLPEARTLLEAAAALGDDLSVFRARWSLAQVTEAEGDLSAAARQCESAEKAAGPGVPLEFRVQVLKEAVETWLKAGKGDDATRVKKRIETLSP